MQMGNSNQWTTEQDAYAYRSLRSSNFGRAIPRIRVESMTVVKLSPRFPLKRKQMQDGLSPYAHLP